MKTIKFSHEYKKIPRSEEPRDTFLLEVLTVDKKDLGKDFIEYDTTYYERMGDELIKKNYPLPKGKVLVLLLNSPYAFQAHLWTTVRRHTPEKEAYYRGLRGQKVHIDIED